MFMCEDFPCCGHEQGCCPRYENGQQMDMVCTCGARLPIDNPTSICGTCLMAETGWVNEEDYEDEVEDIDQDSPVYADYNDFHDEY